MRQWTLLCIFPFIFGISFHLCCCSCPVLEKKGLLTKCYSEGKELSCQRQVSSGTTVELSCRDQYKATPVQNIRQRCTEDGIWTGEPISCLPECGTSETPFNPHITYGQATKIGEWPWHATIYLSKNGGFAYHCGGSLIRDDTVLTAAHCVTPLGSKEPFNREDMLVVLGKHFREKNIPEDYSQSRQVRRISVYSNFDPRNYESDLALIFLSIPVEITYAVRTICFPTNELLSDEFQLQEDSMGVVTGFGKTETGLLADELQYAAMAYIPESTCREKLPLNAKSVLRPTIFCVGHLNDTNVCQGDSGGGIAFLYGSPGHQRWYIQGLVSGGLQPDSKSTLSCNAKITFFTRISSFDYWIKQEMLQVVSVGETFTKELFSLMESMQSNMVRAMEERLNSVLDAKFEDRCDLKPMSEPSNCAEIQKSGQNKSGIYTVTASLNSLEVYCDMETDGGGWTVFQRRDDVTPNIDFYRYWADYKGGFGDLDKEFWTRLDLRPDIPPVHVPASGLGRLRGNKKFAFYHQFSIGDEWDKYRLYIEGYQGDAGDNLNYHNGHAFSTRDRDNDAEKLKMAQVYHGAWWYYGGHHSNLNGKYLRGEHQSLADGVNWVSMTNYHYSLKKTEMKIRPIDF